MPAHLLFLLITSFTTDLPHHIYAVCREEEELEPLRHKHKSVNQEVATTQEEPTPPTAIV